MQPDVACYSVVFDQAATSTVLSFDVSTAGSYLVFTEHLPREFAAEAGLTKAGEGNDDSPIAPAAEELITERLTPEARRGEADEEMQDKLGELGVALGAFGLLLGLVALVVACIACSRSRSATPKMQAVQMSAVAPPAGAV